MARTHTPARHVEGARGAKRTSGFIASIE